MDAFVLRVDKPVGPTSHDIVQQVRRALRVRRVGHTGTLDPFASGLLLVCVGWSTRLAEYLVGLPKTYRARMRLGIATDTDDHTGEVLARRDASAVDRAAIDLALRARVGTHPQRPPAFSAKRAGGRRAHAMARAGEAFDLEPVPVRIDEIVLRSVEAGEVEFDVTCGKGTFVRAIARDVGEALGVGGCLTALRRTGIGSFGLAGAVAPDDLEDPARLADAKITPTEAVAHLPQRDVSAGEAERVRSGGRVRWIGDAAPDGPVAIRTGSGSLLAIAETRDGWVQPRKVFG